MRIEYTPQGVCSRKMILDIDDGIITDAKVEGGCNGNLKGICSLIRGMKARDVLQRLEGLTCGSKGTSCPDQMSKAIKQYLNENEG